MRPSVLWNLTCSVGASAGSGQLASSHSPSGCLNFWTSTGATTRSSTSWTRKFHTRAPYWWDHSNGTTRRRLLSGPIGEELRRAGCPSAAPRRTAPARRCRRPCAETGAGAASRRRARAACARRSRRRRARPAGRRRRFPARDRAGRSPPAATRAATPRRATARACDTGSRAVSARSASCADSASVSFIDRGKLLGFRRQVVHRLGGARQRTRPKHLRGGPKTAQHERHDFNRNNRPPPAVARRAHAG